MVSVGGKRHSGSSDQMMIAGVLVAFVIVVVVVVVVLVILLPIDVEVAVVNLRICCRRGQNFKSLFKN